MEEASKVRRAVGADIPAIANLINDPAIRPFVGGDGYLDPTALIADRRNICLFSHGGGAIFAWRGPGIFEGHCFFRVRGREALDIGASIIEALFRDHGATMIWGPVPLSNRPARWYSRKLGFRSLGRTDTPEGPRELFVMER